MYARMTPDNSQKQVRARIGCTTCGADEKCLTKPGAIIFEAGGGCCKTCLLEWRRGLPAKNYKKDKDA